MMTLLGRHKSICSCSPPLPLVWHITEMVYSLQMEVNTLAPSLELASESPWRSLVKACSWRFIAALITLSTSLFFSREYVTVALIVDREGGGCMVSLDSYPGGGDGAGSRFGGVWGLAVSGYHES